MNGTMNLIYLNPTNQKTFKEKNPWRMGEWEEEVTWDVCGIWSMEPIRHMSVQTPKKMIVID